MRPSSCTPIWPWSRVPPTARNPVIPEALSAIVLRLLAKMPEERYQSAESLLADLREAAPAVGDLPDHRALRARPPGLRAGARRAERALRAGRRALRAGGGRGTHPGRGLRAGAGHRSGGDRQVGARHRVQGDPAEDVAGWRRKFDPVGGQLPYGAFGLALRAFVRGLLGNPAHVVGQWRARLAEALGANAGLLTDLIPELRQLVGRSSAAGGSQERARPRIGSARPCRRWSRRWQPAARRSSCFWTTCSGRTPPRWLSSSGWPARPMAVTC